MSNLSTHDLVMALECVQTLLVPRGLDEFTAVAIRVIPPLVRAKLAGYNEVDPPRGRFGFAVHPASYATEGAIEKWVRYAHENPLIQHLQKNQTDFGVYKITDFVPQDLFRKTGLCRELYKGLFDAEYQIAMPFPGPGTAAIAIVFNRATDFTERDRELLTLLQPLVVQAYRNAAAYSDLQMAHEEIMHSIKENVSQAGETLRKFRLTHREVEVVKWLARGESNKQIARRMGVKFRTIEKHIEHILPKMKVTSRTAACVLAASVLKVAAD